MTDDWRSGLVLAFVLQALVLAALIWRAPERPGNRFLAAMLTVLAGILIVYPLGWHGHNEVPVWLTFLPTNLPLAIGPLIYAYACATAQLRPAGAVWLHMAAPASQFVYLATLSLLPWAVAYGWKETVHDHVVKPLVEFAVLISLAGYGVASLRALRVFRARLAASRSDADLHDARWLRRLLVTLCAVFALLAVVRVYTNFVAEIDGSIYLVWLAAWSAWLGIEGWRVAHIQPPVIEDPNADDADRGGHDWAALGAGWRAQTSAAGWWREPDLTLAALARLLGTNTLYLSRAINEGLGMNFNEMINRLRAEDVARRLAAGEEIGLLELAFEAGFSSKATFNRAFSAAYGVSPSVYRQRLIS